MESCVARIAEREQQVRAFAWFDPTFARRAAELSRPGPLHGLPLGIKDIFDTADMPTEYGSPIWRGWRPRSGAASVAWARAAGAAPIGKTVTTEFAARKPGPTTNPHNPIRTPGGSSSGSAAGVAAGFFPFAFGSQTAGSVIRPAAFCGVVGYKPTFGLISRTGIKAMSDTMDTVGVIARSVADCALLAGAVSGADLGDPDLRPDREPRIGMCRSPVWLRAEPPTQALFARLPALLEGAGAIVEDRELPELFKGLEPLHTRIMDAESARSLGWELASHRAQISPLLLERLESGLALPLRALDQARAEFERARIAFPAAVEALDILVTPAARGEAPQGLGGTGDPVFNAIWTGLHVPCVTVPAGTGPAGMPLGVQLVARRGEDRALLGWARWVQNAIA
jgi:Asp-tRNA(Asn)/Glu-tRNA(Gln) amidotransferase A subunit family amidase